MSRNKLFLIDAMALLYRAHFAFIRSPRITSKGVNTSAVFGFTNTLLELLTKEDPTHLAVVFDTSAPTFRHEQFEAYKAHREAQPEDIATAIPLTCRLLEAMNIHTMELDGYEADDIIGTISREADYRSTDVFMLTPDKDYAQLVQDHVYFYKPKYKGGGFDVLGPKEVEEKFGLPPSKIVDFLGLKGDAVDNIPGIPKIGDKTAVELLTQFGSVEEIIERADEITKKSIQKTVKEHAEQGLLSKQLATIKCDVPIKWSLKEMEIEHANMESLAALMDELEFRTTGQRILNTKLNPMHDLRQQDLFGNMTGDAPNVGALNTTHETIEDVKTEYHLLRAKVDREFVIREIKKAKRVCFDTETTSLDALEAELVGVSFAVKPGKAWFLHIPAEMKPEEIAGILGEFAEVMQDPEVLKIGQNLKYDLHVLRNHGLRVSGPMFDTMLAHYVIDPNGKHGMDAMAEELLGYSPVKIEALIGKKGRNQKTMREVEIEPLVQYACEDADITLRLYEKLAPQVKGNKVFEEIEQPLMPILADMEFEGVKIDDQALAEYSEELEGRLVTLEKEVYQLAGEEFNVNSPKQLGEILFDKLGIGKGKKQKKTKTGQYVTDEQTLTSLAASHELPDRILAYRGVKKLKSTYVDALPKLINPHTGRVHTTFSQSVAVTGRLSSTNPNLQNIPIRTADGREVRKGFIPRSEEYLLLSADYSQVELRIMAAMSEDPAMMEAFQNHEDIHRATAARVFGVSQDKVTPNQRSAAKTVNFGIIYGISAFGLSQRMGIPRSEAKEIIDTYFEQYSRVKAFMDECIERAREQGYVETLFGRRRYLPDIQSRNPTVRGFAERNAINSPIQGTAADIIKLAMIRIGKELGQRDLRSRMTLQVHDELIFDVHRDEVEELKPLVQEQMIQAVSLAVPMEVEMGVGKNWLEAH